MKAWKAEFSLLFITLIWGGTFTFTKIGLDLCPPMLYILIRFSIALLISLLFFGKYLKNIDRKTLVRGIILGLFLAGGFMLQTIGLQYTTISKSAFITGVSVPLVPFVFWIVSRKIIDLWQKIAVVVVTIGLWVFTNPDFDNINLGDLLTLGSTFFWAFYITYMDVFTSGKSEFSETAQLVLLQLITTIPIYAFSVLFFEESEITVTFNSTLIISLAYNGILASFLLTYIHTSVQRYTTPIKAALIFSLEPVIASLIAMLFMNELLNTQEVLGAGVLFFGILISIMGSNFRENQLSKINK